MFIQTALWKKLTVGCRLASWQPTETACPLNRAQETMEHALTECRFLPTAFHLAVQCLGPIPHEGGTVVDPKEVLINTPVLSVTTPLGLVYWSAVRASWSVRCKHKFLALAAPPSWSLPYARGSKSCRTGNNTPAPPSPRMNFLSVYFFLVSFCPCLPGPLDLDKLPPTPPPCPLTA